MSLRLKISAKEDTGLIVINECTGKFNGGNTGGWGGTNQLLTEATSAQFEIYPPEITTPIIINVFPDFPTDDKGLGYEILAAQLSMTSIESGSWRIGYRVAGVDSDSLPFEKYAETNVVFTQTAECCVDKLIASTANVPVNIFMKDDKKKAAVELSALMQDALWAKKCGKFNAAQTILKFINLQCQCC